VPEILTVRNGLPRFAGRIASGEPAAIVAFGTSMTLHSRRGVRLGARYLDALVPSVRDIAKNDRITLHCKGLEGFNSLWAAYRVHTDVIPLRPDLVLLEFAHNDTAGAMRSMIPYAMHAIVAQIREALPASEIAIVILQPRGLAAPEPSDAMRAHEAIADYYGFPSFDLATLSERLVAEGRELTFDGTHHNEAAAALLGVPFADAFIRLIRASASMQPCLVPPPDEACRAGPCNLDYLPLSLIVREFRRARRASAASFAGAGWTAGSADEEDARTRNAAAYVEEVARVREAGASMRFRFRGTHALAWALGTGGAMRIDVDGRSYPLDIPKDEHMWVPLPLTPDLDDREHRVTVTAERPPLVLGDIYFIGELLEE
jgi:lysophospholipase L1-like esterase